MLHYLILRYRCFIILMLHFVMLHYFHIKRFDAALFNDTPFDVALYLMLHD